MTPQCVGHIFRGSKCGMFVLGILKTVEKFEFSNILMKKYIFWSGAFVAGQEAKPAARLGFSLPSPPALGAWPWGGGAFGGTKVFVLRQVGWEWEHWRRISISLHPSRNTCCMVSLTGLAGTVGKMPLLFLLTLAPHRVWKCLGNPVQRSCGVPNITNFLLECDKSGMWSVIKTCATPAKPAFAWKKNLKKTSKNPKKPQKTSKTSKNPQKNFKPPEKNLKKTWSRL